MSAPRMVAVESSSVVAVGYDEQRNELHVEFVGGAGYVYSLVPPSTFAALLAAESVGTFVNTVVKPHHAVRALDP